MRRSSEPEERAQFTVAELLARYGEATSTTGRRHRRAADDPPTPAEGAAQAVAQPVAKGDWVGTREPTIRPSEPLPAPDRPHLNGRAGQEWTPAVGPSSVAAGRVPVTPPLAARRAPGAVRFDGPVTDQLPRLDPVPVDSAAWSSRRPASAQPAGAQRPAGLGTATRAIPEWNENTSADETQARESDSPLWEWAVMVSQIGIGVVGGAALWLICEWLWQRIPVVALVVALAVITGLVWVVRRVRRAEDLQTTVIAVLVGLFVTVSPAALLLVGR